MEDYTKVVLNGTYDGFTRLTDGLFQIAVILDGGERVEVSEEHVISASEIVKKNEIKLKDVIKRIKGFDLFTQAVWINGILNELGSGYGLMKYKSGYEQGKLDGAMEREKVQVPQFVADYIKYAIENDWDFQDLFKRIEDAEDEELRRWVYHERNQETFATAWINGYDIEEEKRYRVKMKGIEGHNSYLKYNKNLKHWYFGSLFIYNNDVDTRTYHTHKELEEAGFCEVFNSLLFEVEEVEE